MYYHDFIQIYMYTIKLNKIIFNPKITLVLFSEFFSVSKCLEYRFLAQSRQCESLVSFRKLSIHYVFGARHMVSQIDF